MTDCLGTVAILDLVMECTMLYIEYLVINVLTTGTRTFFVYVCGFYNNPSVVVNCYIHACIHT